MKNIIKVDLWPLFIFLIAILTYSNTLNHNFVLDDAIVITKNEFVKKGIKGIPEIIKSDMFKGFFQENKKLVQAGRYRPLPLMFFAIINEYFGMNAQIYHLINIIFYAILCTLIYILILKILELNNNTNKNYNKKIISFFATLLFTIHPIHTEVVANVKGLEEILSLLFSVISIIIILKNPSKTFNWITSSIFFFLALLSKENSITLLLIIPLIVYIFYEKNLKKVFKISFVFLIPVILYLIIRFQAIKEINYNASNELLNNPFLYASKTQKISTILFILLKYLKLLIIPYPLTIDYYPYHIKLQNFGFIQILSLIIHITWIIWLFTSLTNKSQYFIKKLLILASFIWLSNIFLVSNIFINIGTFMNERFIFYPSISISLVVITIILKIYNLRKILYSIIIFICIIFFILTINRNKIWKDNFTLFTNDVKISTNSAKINCMAGGILYEKSIETNDTLKKSKYIKQSMKYLNKAISIHPLYVDALRLKGNLFVLLNNYDSAAFYYLRALKIQPKDKYTWQNSEILLNLITDNQKKLLFAFKLLDIDSSRYYPNYICGNILGKIYNNIPLSIKYLKKAAQINPDSYEVCKDLGVAYGITKNYEQSEKWLKKAIKLNPSDYDSYYNLALTYYLWGKVSKYDSLLLLIKNVKRNY